MGMETGEWKSSSTHSIQADFVSMAHRSGFTGGVVLAVAEMAPAEAEAEQDRSENGRLRTHIG